MSTALVVGNAECVWQDLERYEGPADAIIAVNCIGMELPRVDAWVTLHPLNFPRYVLARHHAGLPEAGVLVTNQRDRRQPPWPAIDHVTEAPLPGHPQGGSSGLFGAKFALIDWGFDRVVFCGCPLTQTRHAVPHPTLGRYVFETAPQYQRAWSKIPAEFTARMRSMSGWTRQFLGPPWPTGIEEARPCA